VFYKTPVEIKYTTKGLRYFNIQYEEN